MSSLEQFHSGFGEIITNQFAKCIEFSGDLDVTFDEYSEKLLDLFHVNFEELYLQ